MNGPYQIQTTVQGYPVATRGVIVNRTLQAGQLLYAWKQAHLDMPDYWLRELLVAELNKMLIANLAGRPSAEVVPMTADLWIDIIGAGLTPDDEQRVRQGFAVLWKKMKRWPQPAELLEVLPPRRPAAGSGIITKAAASDEDHARAAAEFQKFMEGLQ